MAMIPMRLPLLATIAALALAGCAGNMTGEATGETAGRIAETLRVLGAGGGGRGEPTLVVVQPGPSLLAEIPSRNASSLLSVSAVNGPVTTWLTPDSVSLGLSGPGVVVATRGLGHDLHIAEAAASSAALAAGRPAQGLARTHRSLGGDGRLRDARFTCQILAAGRETVRIGQRAQPTLRFEEHCAPAAGSEAAGSDAPNSDTAGFTNIYWRDPSRPLIWRSQQQLTPQVGPIILQRMVE